MTIDTIAIATPPKKSHRGWWIGGLVGLAVAVGLISAQHTPTIATPPLTITNAVITSPTRIEFDYHAPSSCSNLTFGYTFFDVSGNQVDATAGDTSHSVVSGTTYHVTSDLSDGTTFGPTATRFDVAATCHDQ